MAVHDLWLGGERTSNPDYQPFPQKATCRLLDYAQHKKANLFEVDRRLAFDTDALGATADPADRALQKYLCSHPIAALDDIRVIRLDPMSSVLGVGFLVEGAEAGMTFDFRLDSTGAQLATTVAPAFSGATGYPAGAEQVNTNVTCPTTFPTNEAGCPPEVGGGVCPVYTNWNRFWYDVPLNTNKVDYINIRVLTAPTDGVISSLRLNVHAIILGNNKARAL